MSKKTDHREDIAFAVKALANALNRVEAVDERLDYVLERHPDWNSEVLYQIREGATKLGYALACLTVWYDDPDEKENENE